MWCQDGVEAKKKKKKNKKKGGSPAAVVVDEAVPTNRTANESQEAGVGAVDEDEEDGEPRGDSEGKVAGRKFMCDGKFCDRG